MSRPSIGWLAYHLRQREVQEVLRGHSLNTKQYETKEFTPEMRQAIEQINKLLKRFLYTYGLREFVEITPENIEYTDCEQDNEAAAARKDAAGHYRPNDNKIALFTDWKMGNYRQFIRVLVHEMVHMQSFQSFEVIPDDNSWKHWTFVDRDEENEFKNVDLRTRRVGIESMRRNGKLALRWLNEAVTEELTKRFMQEHEGDIGILGGKRRMVVLGERSLQFTGKVTTLGEYDGHSYRKERDKFNQLVNAIFKHGRRQYRDRDEVFKLFTRAALQGRLLPIARAIDKAEGRGMFRKLAELDSEDL